MGFFSFFATRWLGIIGPVLTAALVLGVAFIVVVGLLAFTGSPGDCSPGGGPITVSVTTSEAFKQKWDDFNATLDGGSPTSVTFNESEISSRTDAFLRENDAPFSDARVCIHDGFGEAMASLDAFLGLDAKIKVKGTLDLTGDHPVAHIDDIEIGNVPGFISDRVEGLLEDAIEDQMEDIDLNHTYAPALTEGQALIDGQP